MAENQRTPEVPGTQPGQDQQGDPIRNQQIPTPGKHAPETREQEEEEEETTSEELENEEDDEPGESPERDRTNRQQNPA